MLLHEFENYNMFCEERDEKLLKVLMQYYTTRRYIGTNVKGRSVQRCFSPFCCWVER